jgi:ribose 5-phosphate isomerase B
MSQIKNPIIILAADHAGFALKQEIKLFLEQKGYTIEDVGAHSLVADDDYPYYMSQAAIRIAEDSSGHARAILCGKSGQGEAMVANRFPGVRAVVYYGGSRDIITLSREHNDANVLSLGAGFVSGIEAQEIVIQWLETPFSHEERHQRRIDEMDNIE